MTLRELKAPIRAFMREHYTDERLAQLLCHARDGKLEYTSCCCFVGIATADHALQGIVFGGGGVPHMQRAMELKGAVQAEGAFMELHGDGWPAKRAEIRRRILIPMIRAEMKRREWLQTTLNSTEGASCDAVHAEVGAKTHAL